MSNAGKTLKSSEKRNGNSRLLHLASRLHRDCMATSCRPLFGVFPALDVQMDTVVTNMIQHVNARLLEQSILSLPSTKLGYMSSSHFCQMPGDDYNT